MKGRHNSNSNSNSDPPDDWVNGSWTVDCICGVNFDDGEEMVNCDVCGVWVHTRCSRFVRGDKSFACDKCKSLNSPTTPPPPPVPPAPTTITTTTKTNYSEETEVAQLLVELPTKTIKLNNPFPPLNRLWTDRPIQERVHSQGIPGGHPSLFHPVFTSHLWKSTGYIPKKFNFSFREFPCWDDDDNHYPPKPPDDADNGAGVLVSLSKEADAPPLLNLRTQLKPPPSHKKSPKHRKSQPPDSKDNPHKRSPLVRTRERLLPSKDRNANKKTKLIPIEHGGNREKVHASITDAVRAIQGEVHDGKPLNDENGSEKDAGLQQAATNSLIGSSKTDKSKTAPATDEGNVAPRCSGLNGLGCSADERAETERLCQDASDMAHKSAKTQLVPFPPLEDDATQNSSMKIEGAPPGPSVSSTIKLRPCVEDVDDASLETKDIKTQKNLEANILSRSPNCSSKIKSDANLDNLKATLRRRVSDVAKLDGMKDLNEKTFAVNHGLGNFPENTTTPAPNCEHEGDKSTEVSGCQYERIGETPGNPSNSKLEYESSESLIEMPKIQRESNEIPCVVGDVSTKMESISQSPSATLGGKSSCKMVISKSSISDKNRSEHPQNNPSSATCKRTISNSSLSSSKKESVVVDPKTKYRVKDKQKSCLNPSMKASQASQASSSPVLKQSTSVGRDSSKSASAESCLAPSGVGESAASSEQSKNVDIGDKVSSHSSKLGSGSGSLPASSNTPAGLSDEELALLLHQELNSSPRVPRVPRVRHAATLPHLSSVSAPSLLIKRSSTSLAKDQHMISRRKGKDARKEETRKVERLTSSPEICESLHSAENNVECVSPSAANSGPSSYSQSDPNREDDTSTNKALTPSHRTLPALLAEIMREGKRMTYEELCNAVLPHWQSLRKHNGERYAYSSHSQAVLDCLRNRSEWARLVDRGPKSNASRKKRKVEVEAEDGEERKLKENKEEIPKGRRKARKRRKVVGVQQGRSIKDERRRKRRKKIKGAVSDDESSSSSDSREVSPSSQDDDDESQESGMYTSSKSDEVSGSTDG